MQHATTNVVDESVSGLCCLHLFQQIDIILFWKDFSKELYALMVISIFEVMKNI